MEHDGAQRSARLHASDALIHGTLGAHVPAGHVAACVRPNDVRIAALAADDANALPDNAFAAELILASFEGSHIHYQARSDGGVVWDALSADVLGALRLGSRVAVSIDPANVLLLPRDGAPVADALA